MLQLQYLLIEILYNIKCKKLHPLQILLEHIISSIFIKMCHLIWAKQNKWYGHRCGKSLILETTRLCTLVNIVFYNFSLFHLLFPFISSSTIHDFCLPYSFYKRKYVQKHSTVASSEPVFLKSTRYFHRKQHREFTESTLQLSYNGS